MLIRLSLIVFSLAFTAFSQSLPAVEPGVSHELAKWRAARYSDVRYKLDLTLEKMSPVLKGTIEIRVKVATGAQVSKSPSSEKTTCASLDLTSPQIPIILDWRRIRGHEEKSSLTNISLNGRPTNLAPGFTSHCRYEELNEHLIFRDGVVMGENVIKLDFTSPILTSGSAITRYVDKEDGAEYIYSLFVPSDASSAFPVFDQPDLKARFSLSLNTPSLWTAVSNAPRSNSDHFSWGTYETRPMFERHFFETKPISTYVFAFAAGPFETVENRERKEIIDELLREKGGLIELDYNFPKHVSEGEIRSRRMDILVRKSQAAKFKPHAAEVFRLNREGIKYLEQYFDYKFPFPKYDIVLIPEFPFGGMEHAGATFLREASVIFPQEPTKNDYISRANLIFHEAAHQWFGDTVTMKWFDDLWLKEGFAEFMAYKTLEKVMPEYNAWKVFYERNKQAAYLTDSTKGTTPIYQKIDNLSAAKSAYGNIVYRKAPSFLRQAEFYLGEDKFQTAVRAFLKKHEYANAGWEDLVKEFEAASGQGLKAWSKEWVTRGGMFVFHAERHDDWRDHYDPSKKSPPLVVITPVSVPVNEGMWNVATKMLFRYPDGSSEIRSEELWRSQTVGGRAFEFKGGVRPLLIFPNYQDYGYGIFLLDDKSRDYVLKNIGSEKDDFLRSMMWGSLWDSVREGELDPKDYVELVIKNIITDSDESTVQTLLGRVSTAMTYYLPEAQRNELTPRIEAILIDRIRNAPTVGERITFYRAFLNIASTENARRVLKQMLQAEPPASAGVKTVATKTTSAPPANTGGSALGLRTKDRFDIVTRLLVLGDADAPRLLAALEKSETSDDAKRYAYAARAAIPTKENREKYWNDFVNNKDISESWIEAAFGPFNSVRHSELSLPYLERALKELPNHKRNRKIFFINGWLAAFISGQRSEEALNIVNKFLADNPTLDRDLRLKILENVDLIERAVKIRNKLKK